MRKALPALLFVLFGWIPPAFGGGGSSGTSSLFLLGAGTRAVGMGGSFVSIADDASAVFWNPAGLAGLSFGEFGFSHVTLPEGSDYDFAGLAYSLGRAGSVGGGFLRIGTDGIFSRDARAAELGNTSYSETEFLASYGCALFPFLKAGGSFKLYSQSLAGFSANAVSTDLGLLAGPIEGLSLGVNAQDLAASDLQLNGNKEAIPRNFKAGASYHLPLRSGRWGVLVGVDAEKSEKTPAAWHGGAELGYLGTFFLRGGYDREAVTFGLGLAYNRLGLDYAYKSQPEGLGASHRFGFRFQFGRSIEERNRRARQRKQEQERENFLLANRARLEDYRQRAGQFLAAGKRDSALAYVRLALGIDPENEDLKKEAGQLESQIQVETEAQEREALALRLREEAFRSAKSEYAAGNYRKALGFLEERVRQGDGEFVELSNQIQASLDSAKKSLDSTGWAAFGEKKFEAALTAWEKMSGLDPGDTVASGRFRLVAEEIELSELLKRGIADFEAGRLISAEEAFEKVLARRPRETVATAYLQKIRAAGTGGTTLEDLRKDPEAWRLYNEGLAAYTAQEYQKAIDTWQKLLERYPNNEALLRNLADARKRLK